MFAKDLISETIPPLKTSDSGLKALSWMEEFKVSHMPIVNNVDFLGLISDADILDMNTPEEPIGAHQLSLIRPFVYETQHLYDVLKLVKTLKVSIVPVLNAENHYVGNITLTDLINHFASALSVQNPGGILVLELNSNDYSLSEIAQIVESNDAKILSTYLNEVADSTKIEVVLKINREDLRRIIQTFNRYQYKIKATIQQSDFEDDIRQRYDLFMNYINM
jgi:CBS domain-containing protein